MTVSVDRYKPRKNARIFVDTSPHPPFRLLSFAYFVGLREIGVLQHFGQFYLVVHICFKQPVQINLLFIAHLYPIRAKGKYDTHMQHDTKNTTNTLSKEKKKKRRKKKTLIGVLSHKSHFKTYYMYIQTSQQLSVYQCQSLLKYQ